MFRASTRWVWVAALVLSLAGRSWAALVVPPGGTAPDGRTYSQLAANWWQWAISIPLAQSPLLDHSGDWASINQTGQVWFLAPALDGDPIRYVNVPQNKYLLMPVITGLVLNAPEENYTEAEMRAQLDAFHADTSVLYATLDRQQVPNIWSYRTSTPAGGFAVDVPDANLFGLPEGRYGPPAVGDGWFLLFEPLSVGQHTLRFDGGIGDPNNPTYYSGVTYIINSTPVPEPATAVLLAAGAMLLLPRRRTRAAVSGQPAR